MVLPKMEEGGGKGVTPEESEKVMRILREYKPLECNKCSKFVGLLHRINGTIICAPHCPGEGHENCFAAALVEPSRPLVEIDEDDDSGKPKAYKHVSSIHKNGEKVAGPSPVSPVRKSFDAVDKGGQGPSSSVTLPKVREQQQPPKVEGRASTPTRNENEMISATNIRKSGLNPFFRGLPSTKPEAPTKTRSQVMDEDLGIEPRSTPPAPGSRIVEKVEDVTESPPAAATTMPPNYKPRNPFAKAAPIMPFEQKTVPEPEPAPKKRHMWLDCKFSETLQDGAAVKTSFLWNINMLQIVADDDEQILVEYQDQITKYVKKAQKMTRPPIVDEMVIADYGGEFYRGRVTSVTGDTCRVVYVDFGDERKDVHYTELYEINDELMKAPIYSVMVRLDGVKKLEKKVKPGKKLSDIIYSPLQLQQVERITVSDKENFKVVLWLGSDKHLNEVVLEVLNDLTATAAAAEREKEALHPKPVTPPKPKAAAPKPKTAVPKPPPPAPSPVPPPPPVVVIDPVKARAKAVAEYKEDFVGELQKKELVDYINRRIKKNNPGVKYTAPELISMNGKMGYHVQDTRLLDPEIDEEGLVQGIVTHAKGLDAIYVVPTHPSTCHEEIVEQISYTIEDAVEEGRIQQRSFITEAAPYEMFVVKWLCWSNLFRYLSRMKWTLHHNKSKPRFDESFYDPMKKGENKKWVGKWFRAFFRNRVSGDTELNEVDCSWYCLVDLGMTIAVPNKYVYRINFNLMLAPAFTFCIRLITNGVTQYSHILHRDTFRLFDLEENTAIKFKIVGQYERCLDAVLLEPSEASILEKLPSFRQIPKTDDILYIKEEALTKLRLSQIQRQFPNRHSDEFKLAVLQMIRRSFELSAEVATEVNRCKEEENTPFWPVPRMLGGFSGMNIEVVPSL